MTYIKAEHLKYRYPNTKKLALDDLNFEIEKGSFIGIAGKNGAGKSTLCQAFSGLVPQFFKGAYGGTIMIGDQEASKTPVGCAEPSVLCSRIPLISFRGQKRRYLRRSRSACRILECRKKR